jgi:hydrogenase expression/formation protein HypE
MKPERDFALHCPLPLRDYPVITMAHGGGGLMQHKLLENLFWPAFQNPLLAEEHDGAVARFGDKPLAFTTDSYVVHPLFFPGGNIGTLAINGTVNDLCMCGARPKYLSAGFILEEGLPMETLWRVVQSMKAAAAEANVQVVTGDIKVVDKGKGDGLYINTAGIGVVESQTMSPSRVQPGDAVLLSGDIGRHGVAIMAVREGLDFETTIESDCTPLVGPVMKLLEAGVEVHWMRGLTRGGMATTLAEIARKSGFRIHIDENTIAVAEGVRGACEMLGLDPLYVANEGRFVAFVAAQDAERALSALQSSSSCANATRCGSVLAERNPIVTLKNKIGSTRILDMLMGEQLPRIC